MSYVIIYVYNQSLYKACIKTFSSACFIKGVAIITNEQEILISESVSIFHFFIKKYQLPWLKHYWYTISIYEKLMVLKR